MKRVSESGLTIIELLIALAIIAIVATTAPNFMTWVKRYGYKNTYHMLQDTLANARNTALSQNTTSRLVVQQSGDTYTLRSYVSPTPVSNCNSGGSWTEISAETMKVTSSFQVTGGAMSGLCFYRNGSSSGGTYNVVQKNGGTDIGSASITVIVATGFLNVTATN